eukprot:6314028-Amphidinium_carterae.1
MPEGHDPEVESHMADEEPIFETENDRLETGRTEVEPVDMEVDDGSHWASTFASVDDESHRVSTFTGEHQTQKHPEPEQTRTHGSDMPGVSSDQKTDEFVDCITEIATIDSSCIRDFGDETLSVIVKKELVLKRIQ